MSARSPRSSLSGASSAEVADDFGESLKDLQMNNRYEISNLTQIARENTEHAQAISTVLEKHIKTIGPTRKLPALYVLDSIVKNVGTPYTVYLGRNLFSTFMEAYLLVDVNTRRLMEGMLKTWKEAVPGSMDPRPVFPTETVRHIENALIKAKTQALQSNNRQAHIQGQGQPHYRNTPTPPQYDGRFATPQHQAFNPPTQPYGNPQPQLQPYQQVHSQSISSTPPPPYSQQYPSASQPTVTDLDAAKRDVTALIARRQAEFGANPYDQNLQGQLKSLLDLKTILDTQERSPAELQLIRTQVAAIAAQPSSSQRPTPQPNIQAPPQWQPQTPMQQPSSHLAVPVPYNQGASAMPQLTAPLFAAGALDGLQALLGGGQKPGTPQMRNAAPALQHASHAQLTNLQSQTAAAPNLNGPDLIASLARNGLLPSAPPAVSTPPVAVPTQQSTADLLKSLQNIFPTAPQTGTPTLAPAQLPSHGKPHIPMNAASLKTFRPELVHALYDSQPNQCNTCGRRFLATPEGRAKKDRHLDWHFRTNQRIADPALNRGAHRDWYLPEIEWINLKDFDPSTTSAADAAANSAAAKKQHRPEDQYVRAPPGVTRNTCNIDFEEMKTSYSEELQDWVFMNATMHAGKIVHATCLAEMQKGQQQGGKSLAVALGGPRQRSATPEGSLGKRKAEGALTSAASRMKMG